MCQCPYPSQCTYSARATTSHIYMTYGALVALLLLTLAYLARSIALRTQCLERISAWHPHR